jgi:hypothetical protein
MIPTSDRQRRLSAMVDGFDPLTPCVHEFGDLGRGAD